MTKRLTATLLAATMLCAWFAPTALAGGNGNGLVPTSWFCGAPLGPVTINLPPVTNPKAPFPGFVEPGGVLYVVTAIGPIGGPDSPIGKKTGLGTPILCISYDFGVEVQVAHPGT
ncbi:MAG TPA: hypothetical protein VEY67_06390 [Candidatus Dormibacteraeota bacterium]|nr:hypothetical protein [Candidatus Dormibacteraeota bacterium]